MRLKSPYLYLFFFSQFFWYEIILLYNSTKMEFYSRGEKKTKKIWDSIQIQIQRNKKPILYQEDEEKEGKEIVIAIEGYEKKY